MDYFNAYFFVVKLCDRQEVTTERPGCRENGIYRYIIFYNCMKIHNYTKKYFKNKDTVHV